MAFTKLLVVAMLMISASESLAAEEASAAPSRDVAPENQPHGDEVALPQRAPDEDPAVAQGNAATSRDEAASSEEGDNGPAMWSLASRPLIDLAPGMTAGLTAMVLGSVLHLGALYGLFSVVYTLLLTARTPAPRVPQQPLIVALAALSTCFCGLPSLAVLAPLWEYTAFIAGSSAGGAVNFFRAIRGGTGSPRAHLVRAASVPLFATLAGAAPLLLGWPLAVGALAIFLPGLLFGVSLGDALRLNEPGRLILEHSALVVGMTGVGLMLLGAAVVRPALYILLRNGAVTVDRMVRHRPWPVDNRASVDEVSELD
ncbi:MAG: hypothetical protein AB2A00_28750 [Myxococcota bacterium]